MPTLKILKTPIASSQLMRYHEGDAGLDIVAAEDVLIPPGDSATIKTGLFIALPKGTVGILKSRSGLSVKYSLEVGAGVIDEGYRGEVKMHLYNFGKSAFMVTKYSRIAQLLVLPVMCCQTQIVESLDDSDRGHNGFGSTGP